MRFVKWILLGLVVLLVGAFLHYTLPQHDIVRISDTEVRRVDFGTNSIFWAQADGGSGVSGNRDVRFINTIRSNGKPMVYRNEDTGWGWPPYLKLDSSNLQTEAADLRSTSAAPRWVRIRHYGWRNEWLSIYPNATDVEAVAGPDDTSFNWLALGILVASLAALATLARLLVNLWRRYMTPLFTGRDRQSAVRHDPVPPQNDASGMRPWWKRGGGK